MRNIRTIGSIKACPRGTIRIGGRCKPEGTVTLAEHAEAWWSERGRKVPGRGTKAWDNMYQTWVDYAFE